MRKLIYMNASMDSMLKLDDGGYKFDESTLIVGEGTYNGIYFSSEEIAKMAHGFDSVPINLDHKDGEVGEVVGYVKDPHMEGSKLRAKTFFDSDTSKYDVAMGFMRSRLKAGDIPNLSIGIWADVEEDDTHGWKMHDGVPDHLALVVHGACNPSDGCGVGMSTETFKYDELPTDNDIETTFTYTTNPVNEDLDFENDKQRKSLHKQILIETIKSYI